MITIYELLGVEEDASKEEIENAYSRLILEYRQDAKFDEEKNKKNEKILNRLKLAYEILTDDEKRKRYDYDLGQKRAESLLENVVSHPQETEKAELETKEEKPKDEFKNVPSNEEQLEYGSEQENYQETTTQDELLSKDEKNKIRKAAQDEFKQKLKKAKQAEAEYNEAYNKAYNDYLRKMGYKVKEPWTWKRVKTLIITILVIIVLAVILLNIPPVKNMLYKLYKENFIIKALVDLITTATDMILGK